MTKNPLTNFVITFMMLTLMFIGIVLATYYILGDALKAEVDKIFPKKNK